MASILFYGAPGLNYEFGAAGSGLGFFGAGGWGASIAVGALNFHTFVTNGNGTVQGVECNNVTYSDGSSGILGQTGTGVALTSIPNIQSTLLISFLNGTAVKNQNAQLIIYDRQGNPPAQFPATGVTTYVAHIVHPNVVQGPGGSGSTLWTVFSPTVTGTVLFPLESPGSGGLYVSGINTVDVRHDYYFALSATPNSIGSKTQYGLYFYVEYL